MQRTKRAAAILLSVIFLTSGVFLLCIPSAALEDPVVSNADGIYLYNLENDKAVFTLNAEERLYPTSTVNDDDGNFGHRKPFRAAG